MKLLGRQWLKVYTEKDEITQMIALFLFTSHNNENFGNNEQFWATSNEHASDQPGTDIKFPMTLHFPSYSVKYICFILKHFIITDITKFF